LRGICVAEHDAENDMSVKTSHAIKLMSLEIVSHSIISPEGSQRREIIPQNMYRPHTGAEEKQHRPGLHLMPTIVRPATLGLIVRLRVEKGGEDRPVL
jgi:hypothetical protein